MPRLHLLLCLLFACQALFMPLAHAQDSDADLSPIERLQADIAALPDSGKSAAEQQQLQEAWQQRLTALQRIESLKEQQADLQSTLDGAPEQLRSLRQQTDALRPADEDHLRQRFTAATLQTLDTTLGDLVARMYDWQNELTAVNSDLIAAETRPEKTQSRISTNQSRANELNEQLRQLQRQPQNQLNQARVEAIQAELANLEQSSNLLRQQLSANNTLLELANEERRLLLAELGNIDKEINVLQDVIDEKRRSLSEQVISDTAAESQQISNHQLLHKQSLINQRLSEELLESSNRISTLSRRNIRTTQQIDHLTQQESALDQQISVLEGSLLLSRILHQEKQALPTVQIDPTLADSVADMRLRQFEINQLREQLRNQDAYLTRLLNQLPEDQRDDLRDDLLQLIRSRVTLVEQLSSHINTLLGEAIALQISENQLQQLSTKLQQTIDDQLFWVASNPPIGRDWLLSLPEQMLSQWQDLQPLNQIKRLLLTLKDHPGWLALLLVLAGIPLLLRKRLIDRLQQLHGEVGHYRLDNQRTTPRALLLTAVSVLPLPILLGGAGFGLTFGDTPAMPTFGQALLQLSVSWFVLHLMYRLFDPQGITIRHFRWSATTVSRLRKLTRRLAWVLLPMVLIISLGTTNPEHLDKDVLGRLVMITTLVLFSLLVGSVMRQSEPLNNSRIFHFGASLILILLPLVLAGMTIWGYHFTAIRLADRMIDTLYLITAWILLQGIVVRNLRVAGRHLAYQRAISKRQAEEQANGTETEVTLDIPELKLEQINQQSLRLARLGLLILFSVLVYLVWSDLISAASYLESITLWEYNSGTADNPLMVPLSAGDLLGAIIVVVLTITLARNLPGLLEILVLSRMELRQGSSYAITTLLSYLIVSVGIISCLSTLGVSWNKLQWLVAALGVGLGFGLQEIFANFVSGLIILFERPVRIGDVVTIGELSGTVNRIRIRATTITDFDRKEIIVPNKTFVTEHLINWSLSDTVTRVTVKIDVAYGSDVALVRSLLLQIAENNPRVLDEPEPLVLFLGFNDNRLDHELRMHVRQLGDRNPAIDETNREIDRLFAENHIEIASRQMDINLRTSQGLERLISTRRE
ncbi:mechanosensitive channel MscK [Pseudomonas sp. MYb185]|uniref:mechanosensitive channel MscK n=1 Tax=Pseudomonas sp. MYb185 TaxID=1848729 RepID=UPI000CFBF015|nr:mechanosensitive channel MscK [Pseudomonas sp. MYb185]PRB80167.1 mechanosensitive channel MscK [Pseudomonas sp. MYb185]